MYIHGMGLGFQQFGIANNHDFSEDQLVAYTIALPNQPLVSGHFVPDSAVNPLHNLEKNNRFEKPILKSLEECWHEVLLKEEKRALSRTFLLNSERTL